MNRIFTTLVVSLFSLFAAGQSVTFNFTGTPQVYVVPDCVEQIEVIVAGAKGGGTNGGNGARVTAVLNVSPGDVLQVFVGGQGGLGNNSGGWNGGGTGHNSSQAAWHSGGGGGASDIRIAPYALANRVIVGGGGGGRGGGSAVVAGGAANCPNGAPGTNTFGAGGGGGTQTAGGAGGTPWAGTPPGGSPGTLGQGGQGGPWDTASGGGGGGGLYGGGGGGNDGCCTGANGGGGGGGGSSLIPTGGTCLPNNNNANGFVTITPVGGVNLVATPANPMVCEGNSVEIVVTGADTYTWDFSPSLDTIIGSTVVITPTSTETFTVNGILDEICEASLSITVTVLPVPVVTISPENPTTCDGEPITLTASGATQYLWTPSTGLSNATGSVVQANPTETTTYTVLGNSQGCTSTATVTVALQVEVEAEDQLCTGSTYFLADGTAVATGGTYVSTVMSSFGCDSIITLTLVELPVFDINASAAICQGESFTLPNGTSVNAAGTYEVTLPALASGCDSTITTVLTVNPLLSSDQSFAICQGETVTLPNGQTVSSPGSYPVTLSSAVTGCDSTVVTNVVVNPVFNPVINAATCANRPYILPNGRPAQASGSFSFDFQSVFGCDSTVVVNYTQLPIYNLNVNAAICQGQSFTLPNGQTVNSAGNYTSNLTTSAGCDSVITVNLSVNPLPVLNLNLASSYCPYNTVITLNPSPAGGTLSGPNVEGNTLNHANVSPGNYPVTYNFTDANGCSNSTSGSYQIPTPLVPAFAYETYCSDLFTENLTTPNTENHQYTWVLDGANLSNSIDLSHRYSTEGTFDLTLTATDNFNCTYSVTQQVDLTETLDLTGFFVANIITPNGDGINDELKLLPIFDDCLEYSLVVFNRWGQQVFEMTPESGPFKGKKENGDDLPGGTYFYTLKTDRFDCDSPELKGWCNGSFVLKRN